MIVDRLSGTAAELHTRPLGTGGATLTFCDVTRPALVLGSSQKADIVDHGAVERRGADVVSRRGGGGAVWLTPGEGVWVDIEIPADDARWDSDVGRAFHWVGELCAGVLRSLGVAADVYRGPLLTSEWSRLICFAGVGPGEVLVDGAHSAASAKLVGISQRRTRDRARFMVQLPERWDPAELVALLDLSADARASAVASLADVAVGLSDLGVRSADIEAGVIAAVADA